MKKCLILILFLSFNSSSLAKEFKSQYNFKFNLPDGYEIFNKNNLYDIYKFSNKDPLVNLQINLAKKRLETQNVELLYNFSSSPLNNISILVFNENYKINSKNVLKQCKKILKIERKIGKRKVKLIECRMHDQPVSANWSMYRENESSYFEGVTTQQIIFMFNKTEFVITVACIEKCDKTKDDLFSLVKSIKF